MILHNKSHIVVYGGKCEEHIFNDIHIYKI